MISIEKGIEACRNIRFLPTEDTPKHIVFHAPRKAAPGSPKFFEEMRQSAVSQYAEEVWLRNGTVQGGEWREVKARHTHSEEVKDKPGCLACHLEQRSKEGKKPAMIILLTVLRNKEPVTLVEQPLPAKQHKLRRGMSLNYHKRIQKKWNKKVAGLTHMVPEQETVILSVSPGMYMAINDAITRAKNTKHALI